MGPRYYGFTFDGVGRYFSMSSERGIVKVGKSLHAHDPHAMERPHRCTKKIYGRVRVRYMYAKSKTNLPPLHIPDSDVYDVQLPRFIVK